jgi:hypothetical protein
MPNQLIQNQGDLTNLLQGIAEEVINSVADKILAEVRDNIMKYVYELGGPNHYYMGGTGEPSYQFLNAFKWEQMKKSITSVTRNLFYDWQGMTWDADSYFHADPERGDQREQLADALNVEGFDNGFFGGKLRGSFWNQTIRDLFSGTLDDWFKEELLKRGFIKT